MKTFKDINTAMAEIPTATQNGRPIILKSSSSINTYNLPFIQNPKAKKDWFCITVNRTISRFDYGYATRKGTQSPHNPVTSWYQVHDLPLDWNKVRAAVKRMIIKHKSEIEDVLSPRNLHIYIAAWLIGNNRTFQMTGSDSHKNNIEKADPNIPYNCPIFIGTWKAWITYRKKRKFSVSTAYFSRAKIVLRKLAGNDADLATKIVQQSLDKQWQGFFSLKHVPTPIETVGTTKKPITAVNSTMQNYWKKYDKDFETTAFDKLIVEVLHNLGFGCSCCGKEYRIPEMWNCNFSTKVRVKEWDPADCIPVCTHCKEIMHLTWKTIGPFDARILTIDKIHANEIYILEGQSKIIKYDGNKFETLPEGIVKLIHKLSSRYELV
jgi:hypothetical protein